MVSKTKKSYKLIKGKKSYKLIKGKKSYKLIKGKKKVKMMGGTLDELVNLDNSKKTIILMGDFYTNKEDKQQYNDIIKKQKNIINFVFKKFNYQLKDIYFYSEAPETSRSSLLTKDDYSSSVIAQYAVNKKFPIKLSSVIIENVYDYDYDKYSRDILTIFENPDIKCIIVAIGLMHVSEIKIKISSEQPDIQTIIVNTASYDQLTEEVINDIIDYRPTMEETLTNEKPF